MQISSVYVIFAPYCQIPSGYFDGGHFKVALKAHKHNFPWGFTDEERMAAVRERLGRPIREKHRVFMREGCAPAVELIDWERLRMFNKNLAPEAAVGQYCDGPSTSYGPDIPLDRVVEFKKSGGAYAFRTGGRYDSLCVSTDRQS